MGFMFPFYYTFSLPGVPSRQTGASSANNNTSSSQFLQVVSIVDVIDDRLLARLAGKNNRDTTIIDLPLRRVHRDELIDRGHVHVVRDEEGGNTLTIGHAAESQCDHWRIDDLSDRRRWSTAVSQCHGQLVGRFGLLRITPRAERGAHRPHDGHDVRTEIGEECDN